MILRDKDKPALAQFLINLSVVCVVLAIVEAFGIALYLAATQWMLIGIALAVWSIYLMVEAHFRL